VTDRPAPPPPLASCGQSCAPGAGPVIVIGVGNALRGDDGAALVLIERLRARSTPTGVVLHEHAGESLGLLDLWQGARAVVLVDAVKTGSRPGTIHRFDASHTTVAPDVTGSCSTHALDLRGAIELARTLGRLPEKVLLIGIEAESFDAGRGLSGEVEAALGALEQTVAREAGDLAGTG
jgi:hydrogenase maturation protease